ncbi:MAG: zinc ABC transporter substrate-binding protein [Firmicutes bacterium]|nr:zinc ABC transporter substrate-binding protein [Bacillota bacterium]
MLKNKTTATILALILILTGITGCSPADSGTQEQPVPSILCAAFAEYDWARQILGDNPAGINLQLLNSSGMDMHSYQPSVADMVKIADADLLIYTGGDSEFWIEDAIESSEKSDRQVLSFMEIFSNDHHMADRYTSDEHDEHEEHEGHEGHGHEEEGHVHSTDEHLWLSPVMAPEFINGITEAIISLDPANQSYYTGNAQAYIDKIRALDADFTKTAGSAQHTTVLFADRYPFKYLLEDYGLEHVAAFPGCSAETEASFDTILALSETVEHLDLNAVVILHKSKPDLANTVINNSSNKDAQVLILNSMQSVTKSDIASGVTWLSIMESNLEALSQALR